MPSRAVLLATHQPPKIRRVRVTDAGRYGTEDVIEQDELLERVRSAGDQALIIPIIGAAGSGKSHLVLWLRAQLDDEAAPNRKIIYLPKGETRLDRVIDLILDGRTGSPFDEIRESVASATRAMSLDEASRRLRDEISVAIRKVDIAAEHTSLTQMREHLRDALPDLLDDPVYSKRLVGDGGPLRRIVEQAAAGGSDEPAEITAVDLDVQLTQPELEQLSRPAKTLLGDLHSMPALHAAAVDLLNDVLLRCLSRIFGVEPMQLVAVMRELRERLFEEDPALELILMIEDFTLLQGIQHDLLEAMIELPRRDGKQVMCAMKTVMAVTSNFFTRVLASSDTLRTRISAQGQVYNLDVPYGADSKGAIDPDAVADFASRYLNAVRLGARHLADSAPVVHNACDACAHRDVCHGAFGTTEGSEYGLYPFNSVALDRMVRSRQETFNPRDLLAVIATTLTTHAQELEDGLFPSAGWAKNFDPRQFDRPPLDTLAPRLQQQIDQAPKPEQRTVLLTFWGGVPTEFRNLPEGIHEAFDVPVASGAKIVAPKPPGPPEPETPEPVTDRVSEAVRSWRDGERLETEYARVIRRVVREVILGAFDAEDALVSQQFLSEAFDQDTDIVIKNSAGSGRPGPDRFRVEFDPSNDNALLFEGILKMQQHGSWDSEDGAETLLNLLTRADYEAARLRAYLEARRAERDSDRSATVALLALSGLLAGKGSPAEPYGLLAAALDIATVTPNEEMPGLWRALVDLTTKRRNALREFALQTAHVSKSTTEPAGVDGSQLTDTLRAMAATWELPELTASAPNQAVRLREILATRLDPALAEAYDELSRWYDEISRLVGDADSAPARYKTWRAALQTPHAAGFLVRARGFAEDGAPAQLGALIRSVGGSLERWPEANVGQRAALIARAPWARLGPVRDHLTALEQTLVSSIEKAQTQQATDGGASPIALFEDALSRLHAAAAIEVTR